MLLSTALTALLSTLALAAPATTTAKRQDSCSGPYTLVASKPGHPINNRPIEAAGNHFFVGATTGPAAYCPSQVGSSCPNATATVLVNGAMSVIVPGGQATFTQTTGALAFTQAHSAYQPDYLTYGGSANAAGVFTGPGGARLAACPVQGQTGLYQVFAEIQGFAGYGCVCFQARARAWTKGPGAWQYT